MPSLLAALASRKIQSSTTDLHNRLRITKAERIKMRNHWTVDLQIWTKTRTTEKYETKKLLTQVT